MISDFFQLLNDMSPIAKMESNYNGLISKIGIEKCVGLANKREAME